MSDEGLPEWAAPEPGPWCLTQWLDFSDQLVVFCLLAMGHEGDCRCHYGRFYNESNSKFLGKLEMA